MVSVVAGKCLFMVSVAGFVVDSAAAGGSTILECIERFLVCCVFLGLVSVAGFCYGFLRGRKTLFYGFRRWLFYGFRRGKELCLCFPSLVFDGFRLLQDRGCLSDGNKTSGSFRDELSIQVMYIYIYIYIYMFDISRHILCMVIYVHVYVCVYIYIY